MTDDVKIPLLPETLKQIVYALQRQANALQVQADKLSDQLDYAAEFPAEDAERMREAIRIVSAVPLRPLTDDEIGDLISQDSCMEEYYGRALELVRKAEQLRDSLSKP